MAAIRQSSLLVAEDEPNVTECNFSSGRIRSWPPTVMIIRAASPCLNVPSSRSPVLSSIRSAKHDDARKITASNLMRPSDHLAPSTPLQWPGFNLSTVLHPKLDAPRNVASH